MLIEREVVGATAIAYIRDEVDGALSIAIALNTNYGATESPERLLVAIGEYGIQGLDLPQRSGPLDVTEAIRSIVLTEEMTASQQSNTTTFAFNAMRVDLHDADSSGASAWSLETLSGPSGLSSALALPFAQFKRAILGMRMGTAFITPIADMRELTRTDDGIKRLLGLGQGA